MNCRFALVGALLCTRASVFGAQTIKNLDGRTLPAATIDSGVETLMRANGVKGLAVALIRDGRVVYLHAFGVRNAKGEPLTLDTIMYGASQTKARFAWVGMTVVEAG